MNRTFSAWISIFVILILQIYETKAICYFSAPGVVGRECEIYCIRISPQEISSSLEIMLTGKEECRDTGIYLDIRSDVFFEKTIQSKWFTADVKVVKLDIRLNDIENIENDAFLCEAFKTVKELEMTWLGTQTYATSNFSLIRNGNFNGLKELEILNIESAGGIGIIQNGVLDLLGELKELRFLQSSTRNEQINIKGFTGSGQLSKLEYVKFLYNLKNTISDTTFVGLTNVKTLDLSSCQIESIGSNSFQPISNSIQEINLKSNLLTSITAGSFDILPKSGLTIDITSNKFHCDCELIYLRIILEQFESNFNGSIACATLEITIEDCKTKNVLESECFNDCEKPPTTEPTANTSTHTSSITTSPTTANPSDGYFRKECYKPYESQPSDVVSVKRPSTYMKITETESGEVVLDIDSQYSSSVIIWFSESQESLEDINCISQGERTSIPITGLSDNVVYSFCLMDKTKSIVSPMDCVSHIKRDSVWLLESSKTLTVTLIVISLMLNVFFGIGIGFWILNYNPFTKSENVKTPLTPLHSATNDIISRNSNICNRKVSNITNNSEYTTRTTLQYDTSAYNVPPLPERPSNMRIFEEPTYATVEEFFKEK